MDCVNKMIEDPGNLEQQLTVNGVCKFLGYSRQSYYQGQKRLERREIEREKILELVRQKRRRMSRCGTKKLLHLLKEDFRTAGIKIGRDRMFDLLREEGLLVKRKKRMHFTTDSNHPFKIHSNLIDDLEIKKVLQVVVADITYIRTMEGFMYLALLTDLYSRKVVGWDISDSLELSGCQRALQMFFQSVPKHLLPLLNTIHHSDRGSQYCSYEYTGALKEVNMQISMAQAGNCYENAVAERVNGILKDEYNLDETFSSKKLAVMATHEAIEIYNNERPHLSLDLMIPQQVYQPESEELFSSFEKQLYI